MPYSPSTRRHMPQKPDARAVMGAMLAHAPTPEAQARVEEMAVRLGVDPQPRIRSGQGNASLLRGLRVEGRARALYRKLGYQCTQSEGSKGAADFIATKVRDDTPGALVRHIQVKSQVSYSPDGLNDAVRRFLGLGRWAKDGAYVVATGATRECLLWTYGKGWAAAAVVHADGTVTVTDGPSAQQCGEVQAAIDKMLRRERNRAQSSRPPDHLSFKERLGR